jgi:hypothetical protein
MPAQLQSDGDCAVLPKMIVEMRMAMSGMIRALSRYSGYAVCQYCVKSKYWVDAYMGDTPIPFTQRLHDPIGQVSAEERNSNCSCYLTSKYIPERVKAPMEGRSDQNSGKERSHKHVNTESCRVAC